MTFFPVLDRYDLLINRRSLYRDEVFGGFLLAALIAKEAAGFLRGEPVLAAGPFQPVAGLHLICALIGMAVVLLALRTTLVPEEN